MACKKPLREGRDKATVVPAEGGGKALICGPCWTKIDRKIVEGEADA